MSISNFNLQPSPIIEVSSIIEANDNSEIDGETLFIKAGGRLRASVGKKLTIKNTQIKLDSQTLWTGSTKNWNDAVISIGPKGTNGEVEFINSIVLWDNYHQRENMFLTKLIDSKIIEAENSASVFCYSGQNSHLENCLFQGIKTWEIFAPPAIASGITVQNTKNGYLNWEAGRLDFIGFRPINVQFHCWLGNGNGGNNKVYHWNNHPDFDNTKLAIMNDKNEYWEGYTFAPQFIDRDSREKVENVKIDYFSNLNTGEGTEKVLIAEYTTNSNGLMQGTYDSKYQQNTANQLRDVLYILTGKINVTASGAYFNDNGYAKKRYDVVTIDTALEIKSYAHKSVDDYDSKTKNIEFTAPMGELNSDYSVKKYFKFNLVPDRAIKNHNMSEIAALTILDEYTLYDRLKYEWYDKNDFPLVTKDGNIVDFGDVNINIVKDGDIVCNYNKSTNTITIKFSDYLDNIKTTGLVNGKELISGGIVDDTQDSVLKEVENRKLRVINPNTDELIYEGTMYGFKLAELPTNPVKVFGNFDGTWLERKELITLHKDINKVDFGLVGQLASLPHDIWYYKERTLNKSLFK